MSRLPRWVGGVGSGLIRLAERLDARKAAAEHDTAAAPEAEAARATAPDRAPEPAAAPVPAYEPGPGDPPGHGHVASPVMAMRPDPVAAVPWGVRVAAEVGWRLLVLAGTLWVLMRVISAVRLVVLAFVAGLLITALLQPTVAWLKRHGVPRGVATAMTFVSGFIIMGLVGWFVVWQVTENLDGLSANVQHGITDLKQWLLDSPFHVTQDQINNIADNLSKAIGNTKDLTSAATEGVQVILEVLTGILLAMFSTLFLLYDGPRIWSWILKLVPAAAREGVAGAGPRAWTTLTAYVRGTVIVALIDAICIGVGIFFLDVPMAVPLAVFIFLFAFIPLVGAVVSGALAVVVALVTRDVFTAAMVLVVVLAVQQIEGHVLQPFILGRAVRVHPLAVVLSVAAGSMVAGIGGAVVAVPLVAVTNTVVGYLRAYAKENAARARLDVSPGEAAAVASPPPPPPSSP
ncbi:AI-2E family transporter [Streptomyces cinnamoneus]|uniref:AI-2E family transporter n=1 Tax=Streptomyces cinnamoneus TaxID=53446 RepID=A0A2G1XED0_STRCJ|nr:AI-2E family transporter [Streptomyces cinnamoneus]PHQ49529.1 AI-2E family transporter [Streptomyces cinnamoneus]PPT14751.1 AI-2E family transporter [Streptomyces cinnamoneus]